MYLISKIMKEIWNPVSRKYMDAFKKSMELEGEEIFHIMKDIRMTTIEYPDPYPNLNLLATCGCQHAIKSGGFSGCTMCNHNVSDMVNYYAMINALRIKDTELYARLVRKSFENKRGIIQERLSTEIVTGCDCLNEIEFPEQVYKELFGENGVFQVRPFRYSFEVRADSVTEEKLTSLYRYIGRGRVYFEIGVEVHSDWLRNHWLNKKVTNRQIEDAIIRIKRKGGKVNANVLLGMPGLTEQQSIDLFVDTVVWLNNLEVDRITFFPLNRKAYTLQGFLYKNMVDNEKLKKIGISQGNHTGLPWLFTIIEAISKVFVLIPDLQKRFGIAQFNIFDGTEILPYNSNRKCSCNQYLFHVIDDLLRTLNIGELMQARKSMYEDPCYKKYTNLLKRQEEAGEIKNTIRIVSSELSKFLWPQNWTEKMHSFEEELSTLEIIKF